MEPITGIRKGLLATWCPRTPNKLFLCVQATLGQSARGPRTSSVQFVHAVVLESGARGEGWWMFSLCAARPIVPSTLLYGEKGTERVLEYARLAMGFANVRASRYGIR